MPGQAASHRDERELLLAFLEQQRDGLRFAAHGLTDIQARRTPTAGALSIGGLITHVTATERGWIDLIPGARPDGVVARGEDEYAAEFRLADDRSLPDALAELDAVAAATAEVVRRTALDAEVPVPKGVPWFPDDVEAWTVRWVLLHLVEEISRHAGHADIVRESIDGATMYELMAGAEGWPATDCSTLDPGAGALTTRGRSHPGADARRSAEQLLVGGGAGDHATAAQHRAVLAAVGNRLGEVAPGDGHEVGRRPDDDVDRREPDGGPSHVAGHGPRLLG